MNSKVRAVLESILERFKSGDIPKAIAYATFPIPDIPCARWSFTNRLIVFLSGTADARGIRQWNRAGRAVKRGAKAIYILVPRVVRWIDPMKEDLERVIVKGFMAQPVFRAEDTEGETLDYEQEMPLPDLPLIEKAKEWGIAVSAVPPFSQAYGVYRSNAREILLASPEEVIFFHELSHAAYERAIEKLKPGQLWNQEITAELCAQVLCHIVGRQPRDNLGNGYRYIEHYAGSVGLSPLSACLQVLECAEKVLSLILGKEENDTDNDDMVNQDKGHNEDDEVYMKETTVIPSTDLTRDVIIQQEVT